MEVSPSLLHSNKFEILIEDLSTKLPSISIKQKFLSLSKIILTEWTLPSFNFEGKFVAHPSENLWFAELGLEPLDWILIWFPLGSENWL